MHANAYGRISTPFHHIALQSRQGKGFKHMTILQFSKDEVTPHDLEHLKALVKEGKDTTGLIASIVDKFEAAFSSGNAKVDFQLRDQGTAETVTGYVDFKSEFGIDVHVKGYRTSCYEDDVGIPIFIEKYDGELLIRAYGDINSDEPTHNVSLEGARLEKRSSDNEIE